jgi:glycerol-3-phosphate dehydrogenase
VRPDGTIHGGKFDLLIVGGGIVGAGVARDAAMRGLRTLLVEQGDFASGTSSRSSRLLHGGLRYLAQGRLGLVHEASLEKMRLRTLAPHLADPLPFLFPTWKNSGWPRWKLGIGARIYDLLCGRRNHGSAEVLSRDEVLQRLPGPREHGLTGGVRYFDGLTNDARLVIDTLRSAERAGAVVCNYTQFVDSSDSGPLRRCELRDVLTQESFTVSARTVVNAAGAWASKLPRSHVKLRLTKGVHLVIDRSRLPVPDAVVLPEGDRIVFIIPWGERAIIGTTDTDYTGDPGAVRTDPADIAYLLGVVNAAFPQACLTPADLISSWAGVRPLVAPRQERAGAPSDLSRAHEIRASEPGWFEVTGGKLTTYRLMAEQTVDRICAFLGGKWPRCTTASVPLCAEDDCKFSSVVPPAFSRAVVEHCCRREWAVHLDDVMLRRTSWHFYETNAEELAQQTAVWMATELRWNSERTRSELARYHTVAEFASRTAEAL